MPSEYETIIFGPTFTQILIDMPHFGSSWYS
jgi:hypothetical protein